MLATLSLTAALAFSPGSLGPRHLGRPRHAAVHGSAASVEVAPFPAGPKDVATQMSLAVQAALAAGETQLALTLPADMRFGIFGDPGKLTIGNPTAPPTAAIQQRAEFELAFLCAEMFRGECTCVLESAQACKAAEREFGAKGMRPRFVPSLKKLTEKKSGGFGVAAKAPAGGSEQAAKVLLLVRPTAADAKKVVKPEGGVVLLLNPARTPAGFEPIYSLEDNPHPDWQGGLLFRCFPGGWSLAVAGKVGPPTVHGRSPQRPTLEQIDRGFAAVKEDTNPFSRNIGAAAALRNKRALVEEGE